MRSSFPYGPQWYAAVMGTGIVAVALAGLPFRLPAAEEVGLAFWVLATGLLVVVTGVMLCEWRRDRSLLRRQYDDPATSHSYGAPAMALLTVGAGSMAVGDRVIGHAAALHADMLLWAAGTALGLCTAVAVPYRAITLHDVTDDAANGGWLMPVVPPMVSAATGAALVPHLPPGQARETFLLVCYALFGSTLIAGMLVLNQLWQRLVRHGALPATAAPTVWIVLGFLGQSTTAVHHLGMEARSAVPTYGHALQTLAVVYGVPVWGFTLLWVALALALTVRQARAGLVFAPTWWSFTFPVGTVVTGTSALHAATGLGLFSVAAGVAMLGLLVGWVAAAGGTTRALLVSSRRVAQRAHATAAPQRQDEVCVRAASGLHHGCGTSPFSVRSHCPIVGASVSPNAVSSPR